MDASLTVNANVEMPRTSATQRRLVRPVKGARNNCGNILQADEWEVLPSSRPQTQQVPHIALTATDTVDALAGSSRDASSAEGVAAGGPRRLPSYEQALQRVWPPSKRAEGTPYHDGGVAGRLDAIEREPVVARDISRLRSSTAVTTPRRLFSAAASSSLTYGRNYIDPFATISFRAVSDGINTPAVGVGATWQEATAAATREKKDLSLLTPERKVLKDKLADAHHARNIRRLAGEEADALRRRPRGAAYVPCVILPTSC
eukprot:TRINITY_DN75706_c0_g1_i1.p1 TRINITY_DN75706_c0_g1~~TRINITY_DN75706_c0_g1_i1.p1  ORF type:complete len:284 (+),score=36.83 TRINITY_DN75706_c0_g1_i1:75-854(+)